MVCPCKTCTTAGESPDHARILRLLEVIEPDERAFAVAQLSMQLSVRRTLGLDDAALAAITGVPADAMVRIRDQIVATSEQRQAAIVQRAKDIAADAATEQILLSAAERGTRWMLFDPRAWNWKRGQVDDLELNLRVNDRPLTIVVPDAPASLFVIYQVFLVEVYKLALASNTPEVIYDLGANVGMASLYFLTQWPDAKIVAVEPVASHAKYVRGNLERNGANGTVVQAAIGSAPGVMKMKVYPHWHSGSSFAGTLGSMPYELEQVEVRVPSAIIDPSEPFGLKMDIEGGEYALLAEPRILDRAAWIQGELHFGDFVQQPALAELLGMVGHGRTTKLHEPRCFPDLMVREFVAT